MKKEDLDKAKKIELEVMDYLDKICKKYDIKYYLFWGTLLGAIRHKGFIPWDDDIDVAMMPDDYNKFLEVMKNENSDKYYLQNIENTKYCNFTFSKIRKYKTTMVEEELNYLPFGKGINVDIFPLYKYPKNKLGQMRFNYRFRLANLLLNRDVKLGGIKGKLIHCFLHLIPRSLNNKIIIRKLNKLLKYNKDFDEYYIRQGKLFKKEWFSEDITLPFEDKKYKAPSGYDGILTRLYGDYMTPPPKDKRYGHGDGGKMLVSFTKEYDEL